MTSEEDFQAALGADPTDWQTRLVLADWLDERGDPRADGYRALGVLRKCPWRGEATETWCWFCQILPPYSLRYELPEDWIRLVKRRDAFLASSPSRREADDAAALAFARLPAVRRAELLKGALV